MYLFLIYTMILSSCCILFLAFFLRHYVFKIDPTTYTCLSPPPQMYFPSTSLTGPFNLFWLLNIGVSQASLHAPLSLPFMLPFCPPGKISSAYFFHDFKDRLMILKYCVSTFLCPLPPVPLPWTFCHRYFTLNTSQMST